MVSLQWPVTLCIYFKSIFLYFGKPRNTDFEQAVGLLSEQIYLSELILLTYFVSPSKHAICEQPIFS